MSLLNNENFIPLLIYITLKNYTINASIGSLIK